MALMLRANKLLAMAKDINDFRFIILGELFFDLLVTPLSYNFLGAISRTHIPPLVWNINPWWL
jgi:hypothetical protein